MNSFYSVAYYFVLEIVSDVYISQIGVNKDLIFEEHIWFSLIKKKKKLKHIFSCK